MSTATTAVPVAAIPAVRHRGVNLAKDADSVDRVVLPGLARDGRSSSTCMLISDNAQSENTGLFEAKLGCPYGSRVRFEFDVRSSTIFLT